MNPIRPVMAAILAAFFVMPMLPAPVFAVYSTPPHGEFRQNHGRSC
jgi:hypothetical protein